MIRFLMLTKLEIKKYVKAFPGLCVAAIMMALIVAGIGLVGIRTLNSTTVNSVEELVDDVTAKNTKGDSKGAKIPVAIVIQDESKAMGLATNMLDSMESVNSLLEFYYVDEQDGKELLQKEEVAVLIIIREKTLAGIMNGENTPIEVLFPENSGYEAAIFKEFADAAVRMLSSAQASVYSIYDFYEEYDKYHLRSDPIKRLNMVCITAVLGREKTFQKENVVVTGKLSIPEYYVCSGITLFLMFFSIMLVQFMRRNSRDIAVKLKSAGVGYFRQTIASLAGPVSAYLLLAVVAGIGISIWKMSDVEALEIISIWQIWQVVLMILPMSLVVSSFALMICRLTDHAIAQVMMIFLVSMMQGLVAGCFIPKLLLPDVMEKIEVLFPSYYMISMSTAVFTDSGWQKNMLILCMFVPLFIFVSVWAEQRKNGRVIHR